jgi:DNA repair protein RadA/Sms
MAKLKTVFICQSCGAKFHRWTGKCSTCGEWETIVEERETPAKDDKRGEGLSNGSPPVPLTSVESSSVNRIGTGSHELDRAIGGGIVLGSLILVGGDPGIGKSTLLLQISRAVARKSGFVLYASGEESLSQIKIRAERLDAMHEKLLVFAENDLSQILAQMEKSKPALLVVDSIQTVFHPDFAGAQGSVGQIRECASQLMHAAKRLHIPVVLIGHVTREGTIAGPKVLEHIVDTVLYFEGDKNNLYRIVRVIKNRFGASNEIAIFEMKTTGLAEVLNPSEIFLAERSEKSIGSIVTCSMEGTQPVLVEVQGLASRQSFGYPQRTCSGIDTKRLSILSAVIERSADFPLSSHDLFVNIVGGIRADEPAIDLPVACAIISSMLNRAIDGKVCAIGEIGLSGEVRSVSFLETRLREAQKMGFNRMLLPVSSAKKLAANPAMEIIAISNVSEIAGKLF